MAKGYWIAHITVTDAESYPEYVRLDSPIIAEWGGKFLVRGGAATAPEGAMKDRHVVVEFKDYETALACYNSPEYQAAAKIRKASAESDFLVVEGM